ncbi:hypothetical protein [Ekhidna sp.]
MSEKRKVEDILAELGKKIDGLIAETKRTGNKVTDEMEERIKKLKLRKEKIEKDFKDQNTQSGEKWEQAKMHLNEAAVEIRRAFKTIFK